MNIKKRIMSVILAVAASVVVSAVSVSAVTAGYSDYGKSDSKTVASVTGAAVSLVDATNGSIIDIPKTSLPTGVTDVTFATKSLSKESTQYKTAETVVSSKGYSNSTVFDLKLLDQNSAPIPTFSGKVSVTLKIVGDTNTVLYFNDSTNTVENLGGTINNGFITFETTHFSYYVLAKATPVAATVTTTAATTVTTKAVTAAAVTTAATTVAAANPKTGDTNMTAIIIFALMSVVALGTAVVSVKVKKAK